MIELTDFETEICGNHATAAGSYRRLQGCEIVVANGDPDIFYPKIASEIFCCVFDLEFEVVAGFQLHFCVKENVLGFQDIFLCQDEIYFRGPI